MIIGGMFPVEKTGSADNVFGKNVLHCMSGRCALYAVLLDMGLPAGSVAYVPAYTCETVLSAYEKAGYVFRFYDTDPQGLKPLYREEDLEGVSVLALCGYFGFETYSRDFVELCARRGIRVLYDTTHTPYAHEPLADYTAGSLRKWMGIPSGGVAVKRDGKFRVRLLEPDAEHIMGRFRAMEQRQKSLETGNTAFDNAAAETFWETEMRLRRMFDAYESDPISREIALHFDFEDMRSKRRNNFNTVVSNLESSGKFRPVFTELGENDVPSHFCLYANDRDGLRAELEKKGVKSTVYWPPVPQISDFSPYPGAQWILEHILSIQLDQRYGEEDMKALAAVLNSCA